VAALRALYREYGLGVNAAAQLIDNLPLAKYFDAVVSRSGNPQQSSNFVLGELSRLANESGVDVGDSKVTVEDLAELIALSRANGSTPRSPKSC